MTKVIFRDFPGPGIFKKKIQDFSGLSRRRGNPVNNIIDKHESMRYTSARGGASITQSVNPVCHQSVQRQII